MDLKDILDSRSRKIAECEDFIISLDRVKDLNGSNELKYLLHIKKDLLAELNTENYKEKIKELKIINDKIYVSSNIIRNNIIKFKEFEKLNPILVKLATKESELKFTDIFKFALKHQFITTFVFLLIGSFVFGIYFRGIDYFPLLNKESFIYFLFILSGIGLLNISLFLFIPIAIQKLFSEIFKIEYMKQNKKMLFIILILLVPILILIIIFIIDITQNIPQIVFLLIIPSVCIFCIRYVCSKKIISNMIIFIYCYSIMLLLFIFISFIIQLFEDIYLIIQFITLILLFLILFALSERPLGLIPYIVYSIFAIFILIPISPNVIKQLHLGNYTPDVLILDPKAKAIIPSDFLHPNNTLKKPKVLSNIGDEYYIELKTAPKKALRLSIPKNLVLSEQIKIEEKPKEAKDTTKPSEPKEKISQ